MLAHDQEIRLFLGAPWPGDDQGAPITVVHARRLVSRDGAAKDGDPIPCKLHTALIVSALTNYSTGEPPRGSFPSGATRQALIQWVRSLPKFDRDWILGQIILAKYPEGKELPPQDFGCLSCGFQTRERPDIRSLAEHRDGVACEEFELTLPTGIPEKDKETEEVIWHKAGCFAQPTGIVLEAVEPLWMAGKATKARHEQIRMTARRIGTIEEGVLSSAKIEMLDKEDLDAIMGGFDEHSPYSLVYQQGCPECSEGPMIAPVFVEAFF